MIKIWTAFGFEFELMDANLMRRYSVDFDLKKTLDENSVSSEARVETKKTLKKLFEEKYKVQTLKTDKKGVGAQYFYSKLRF